MPKLGGRACECLALVARQEIEVDQRPGAVLDRQDVDHARHQDSVGHDLAVGGAGLPDPRMRSRKWRAIEGIAKRNVAMPVKIPTVISADGGGM